MKKTKRKLLAVMLAVILVTLLTQPSLAYYTVIGRATNVVTSGSIELEIHEKTADGKPFPEAGVTVIPGEVVSKIVSVENVCGHPFYLRAKLTADTEDASLKENINKILLPDVNTDYWIQRPDGYYYYKDIIQPGQTTENFITEVKILGSAVNQTHVGSLLTLKINAYAVQSENNSAEAPWLAKGWPAE